MVQEGSGGDEFENLAGCLHAFQRGIEIRAGGRGGGQDVAGAGLYDDHGGPGMSLRRDVYSLLHGGVQAGSDASGSPRVQGGDGAPAAAVPDGGQPYSQGFVLVVGVRACSCVRI